MRWASGTPAIRPIADKVAGALAGRRVLLVLDNVEQVVDAAPKLSALLAESAASVLATSRILLRVRGEQNVPLGPLRSPEAGELFVERARAVKPDFELTDDNARQVIAICGALDNVPLALELAAARLRVLTPTALVERLDHALPLLVDGARDLPERQRTLRATIEWSAQLLSDGERELLLRLGVFRAGFGLDAVEWMSDGLSGVDAVGALGSGHSSTAASCASRIGVRGHGSRCWPRCASTAATDSPSMVGWPNRRSGMPASTWGSPPRQVRRRPGSGQVEAVTRLLDEHDELRGGGRPSLRDGSVRCRRRAGVAALLVLVGRRARR